MSDAAAGWHRARVKQISVGILCSAVTVSPSTDDVVSQNAVPLSDLGRTISAMPCKISCARATLGDNKCRDVKHGVFVGDYDCSRVQSFLAIPERAFRFETGRHANTHPFTASAGVGLAIDILCLISQDMHTYMPASGGLQRVSDTCRSFGSSASSERSGMGRIILAGELARAGRNDQMDTLLLVDVKLRGTQEPK